MFTGGATIEGPDRIEGTDAPAEHENLIFAEMARLCIGAGADLCAVYLRTSGSSPVAFETRVPGQFASLVAAAFDDLYAERAREAGVDRLLHRRVHVGTTPVGAIVMGSSGSGSSASITPALCDAVSTILSTAIAQAAQLAHHHRVSDRLQRAMLPARLIAAEGITFDAAYRPASSEAEVGGDWYDTFEIGNGIIGLSVGDVTGHGLEAAVGMGEIRRALRAAALATASPAAVLDAVESIVSSQGLGMATAIVGIFDTANFVLRYASAGHPSPVLVTASGDVHQLPGGGTLLGLGEPVASRDWTVTLAPDSTCYFYTDGLIENNRNILAGEQRLLEVLELMAIEERRGAHELHARVIGEGPSSDDCATLMLHRDSTRAAMVERYTYSALPAFASLARNAIDNYAARLEIGIEQRFNLKVASGEAIANAIEHGEQSVDATFAVEMIAGGGQLLLRVESRGHWRATPAQSNRGRGIPIMNACARTVEISSTSTRTHVILTFDV